MKRWREKNHDHIAEYEKGYRPTRAADLNSKRNSEYRQIAEKATRAGLPWSDHEVKVALDTQYSVIEAAIILKRTPRSVMNTRNRKRGQIHAD